MNTDAEEEESLRTMSCSHHTMTMKTRIVMDTSNRIVLSQKLWQVAGISRGQKMLASAIPGRIVLEVEPNVSGRIIKRGKFKFGPVPFRLCQLMRPWNG